MRGATWRVHQNPTWSNPPICGVRLGGFIRTRPGATRPYAGCDLEGSSEPDLEQPAHMRGATWRVHQNPTWSNPPICGVRLGGFIRTRPGATRPYAGCDLEGSSEPDLEQPAHMRGATWRVHQNPTWSNPPICGVRLGGFIRTRPGATKSWVHFARPIMMKCPDLFPTIGRRIVRVTTQTLSGNVRNSP